MTRKRSRTDHAVSARVRAWEDRTAWPMFVLALVFFVCSMIFLTDETLSPLAILALALVLVVVWVIFIVDFVVRFALSGDRKAFLRTRWFEAVSLIVPYLRPFVILIFIWRLPWFRSSPSRQRVRLIVLASVFTFLFVYTASTLVWLVEHKAPGANIVSLGDAIWWGFATIATVGYGDYTPITVPGRVIAVGLMMGGLVVLGVTSATVISTLNDQIRRTGQRLEIEREAERATASATTDPTAATATAPTATRIAEPGAPELRTARAADPMP